ncbi:MAG: 3'(2'),5'-bisphosphate nucleotidase CysQ [Pseudomonadota bacterium]
MNKKEICVKFRELALLAGEEILDVYARPDMGVEAKADDSPVTEADRRADDVIYAGLSAAFPEIPIVTEEKSATHSLNETTFFIVDPLDGTKEFIKRRGDFTVNIALVEDGVPTLGVVYAPAKKRLFLTKPGGGATEEIGSFSVDTFGDVADISVMEARASDIKVVASKSHRDAATDDYINKYDLGDFLAAGSSLKFCLVASGEAHLYPRLGRTMEWDTAAGHAVLLAAGGQVVRFDDHTPLTYGKSGFENPFFLALTNGMELQPA